jgi:DNA-binding transcriptional ArsR family regulator
MAGKRIARFAWRWLGAILNHMVQYQQIDRTFAALADPTRRAVVERLGRQGVASVSELAEPAGISLTGMKKHLAVLEEAGLVSSEKVGRTRQCRLGPNRVDEVRNWIEDYRKMVEQRFDRLEELLARDKGDESDGD